MITHTNYRTGTCLSSYEQPILEALRSLVIYELGYGGHVTVLTETIVEVETPVMHKMDRTVFTGPKEEMKALVAVAQAHVIISEKGRDAIVKKTVDILNKMPEETRGVPLYVANLTPMILGELSTKPAVMAGMGITSEADLKAGMRLPMKDLFAAIALRQEKPDVPFRDIIAQATPVAA